MDGEHKRDSEKKRSGWRARDRRWHVDGGGTVFRSNSGGMEITTIMMTRREHMGLENNGGGMFWRTMEDLPKRETPKGERDGEHERE